MALEFAAEEYQKTLLEKSTQQILETEKYSYHKKNTGVLVENKNQPDIADEMYRKQTGDRTILNDERRIVEGTGYGVDEYGRLQVATASGIETFAVGDVIHARLAQ